MSEAIVCPNCGLDDHLSGEHRGDLIRITCSGTPIPPPTNPAAR